MKSQTLIYIFCLIFILGCEETIKNPIIEEDKYYSVEGSIYFEGIPIQGVEVFLELLTSLSDSNGHFKFDSIKAGERLLTLSHPKYIQSDTLLKIDKNLIINISLLLRSDSFYPCNIGNKWFYKAVHQGYELSVQIIDTVQINNETYYKFLYAEFAPHFTDTSKSIYLRQVIADTLYEYTCDEKQLLAPFGTVINQEFIFKRCNGYSTDIYDSYLYEANNDIKQFYYSLRYATDAQFEIHFQRGIGMIRYLIGRGKYYILEKYEINY
ncbi:MAG TPA: carboxypeptidase-like regulatory domain-containing protein [Ignavibacteriaceae bacterium]|nr:carboxypeptidase-like regulatory domain-containing protein [Ignavibacteriaceae bacterium]